MGHQVGKVVKLREREEGAAIMNHRIEEFKVL
jgi:hypothetical protein